MKVLLDTCIVIDGLQKREPFWQDAAIIFRMAAEGKITACITAKSAADIYYLTHRITHSDAESRKIMKKLFTLFSLLDTAGTDCQRALISDMTDYEDAIMAETAEREKVDIIITRNVKDFHLSKVPAMLPAFFLQKKE